jgi:cobalt-zinc-cadmium efflux system outer membrane protein
MNKRPNSPILGAQTKRVPGIWLTLICCLTSFQVTSVVAASLDNKLTLTEAMNRSLEQNPSLKVFALRDVALQGQLETAQLNPAYELDIEIENFAGTKT